MNKQAVKFIFDQFMEIIEERKIQIAFEVYGINKPLLYYSDPVLSKDKKNWILRKRNIVDTFSDSSLNIAKKNNHDIVEFCNKYGYNSKDYALVGGSVPLFNKNKELVAIITVTGLKPSEDDELANFIVEKVQHLIN